MVLREGRVIFFAIVLTILGGWGEGVKSDKLKKVGDSTVYETVEFQEDKEEV